MKKRIVCMLLALLLLVGMLPVGVFAEGKTEYEKNETGTAVFNSVLSGQIAYVSDDPTLGWNSSPDYTITVDKALLSQTFTISDSYVDGSGYWYKLAPIGEEAMPAKLSAKPWVYQNDIPTGGNVDALIITPPANTCRCCESCTGDEDCECGCGECDYCEPVTTDPTTPTDPSQPECGCCENCANAEGCTCGCEACKFCEPEVPADPEIPPVTDPATGAKVYVETLPEGVTLDVDTDVDGSALLSDFRLSDAQLVFAWDISLRNADNTEYQPGSGAMVKIPVNASAGTKIGLLHKHGGGTSFMGVTEVLPDGTIEFYTDSFSEFVGFTVDFHYEGVDYSIEGMSSILLSELFTAMGITEDAYSATSVVFSNNDYVTTERQDNGDWLLTSLEAFQTEETLVITFTGGRSIVIDVTDASKGVQSTNDQVHLSTSGTAKTYQIFGMLYPDVNGDYTSFATTLFGVEVDFVLYEGNAYPGSGNGAEVATAWIDQAFAGVQFSLTGNYWFEVYDTYRCQVSERDTNNFVFDSTNVRTGREVYIRRYPRTTYSNNSYCTVTQASVMSDSKTTRTVYVYANDTQVGSWIGYFPDRNSASASDLSVTPYGNWKRRGDVSDSATVVVSGGNYYVYLVSQNTIKYNTNGGSGTFADQIKTYGVQLNLHSAEPTKAGYRFNYWVSSYDGSTWAKGANFTPDRADTLVANYSPITYTATFNANGGSVNPTSRTFDIEGALSLPTPTRTGYTFTGWKVTSAAGNWTNAETYSSANIEKGKYGDVTFTAQWTPYSYTVKFNGNGSTDGSMTDQSFTYDKAQNLTANAFKREYTVSFDTNGADPIDSETVAATFNGWATTAAGTKDYNDKQSVSNLSTTNNATVNLYAKWSVTPSVTLPTPTKTGFDFKGWYTDAACSAANKVTGTTYTPTSDVTLYAKWEEIGAYKVTYQYEGTVPGAAPAAPAAADVHVGDTVTVATTANITGYTFSGWTTSDAEIKDGKFTMPAKAVTLTGKWIPISYTVKFDGSEGTGSVADISAKYGEEVTLPDNGFERVVTVTYDVNGGTEVDPDKVELEAAFNGWKKENSGDAVAAGTKVSNLTAEDGETVTYYADWKYRSTTTPTTAKPGYAFGGWSDGGKVTMEAGEEFTPTTDIELTAVWTANAYTITYNHNDVTSGDPTITTDTYTIEEALTLAEAPTREGYKFTGWELEKAVTEPVGNWDADTYSAAQTFEKGKYGNITLVAQWEEQYRYVLNFNANGGIGAPATITEEWCDDKEHTFTWTEVPTRTGYTFMGWAEDAASEENVAGADKNSIKLDGEAAETVTKTIFAIWKRDTGTIQLNYSGGVPVVVTVTCTDAVNDEEKITINTVVTSNTTIKDLPTGTYKVTAESGNANYTAYVNPGITQLKSGETANFDLSVSDEGFNWLTGFAHVINKRGG